MRRSISLAFLLLVGTSAFASGQQPFFTDDADTTAKGKFHVEIADELDRLQAVSLPILYQNGLRATLAYGVLNNVEVSVGGQFLALVSDERPRDIGGFGDTTVGLKYKFHSEKDGSYVPALALDAFIQLPTGNPSRSLGSGVTDYGFNAIAQKTVRKNNTVRLNGGYLFAGNTLTGAIGIRTVRGHVFTGGASYVRTINEKLQLGGEITGAVTSSFQLSKGQLQFQGGGNYNLTKKVTLDFGLIAGRFAASPKFGGQIGMSFDF